MTIIDDYVKYFQGLAKIVDCLTPMELPSRAGKKRQVQCYIQPQKEKYVNYRFIDMIVRKIAREFFLAGAITPVGRVQVKYNVLKSIEEVQVPKVIAQVEALVDRFVTIRPEEDGCDLEHACRVHYAALIEEITGGQVQFSGELEKGPRWEEFVFVARRTSDLALNTIENMPEDPLEFIQKKGYELVTQQHPQKGDILMYTNTRGMRCAWALCGENNRVEALTKFDPSMRKMPIEYANNGSLALKAYRLKEVAMEKKLERISQGVRDICAQYIIESETSPERLSVLGGVLREKNWAKISDEALKQLIETVRQTRPGKNARPVIYKTLCALFAMQVGGKFEHVQECARGNGYDMPLELVDRLYRRFV